MRKSTGDEVPLGRRWHRDGIPPDGSRSPLQRSHDLALLDGKRLRLLPPGNPGGTGDRTGSPTPHLLTIREVAARLRVCRATAYKLCERGELPHLRIANAIRVDQRDLEAFLQRLAGHSGQPDSACRGLAGDPGEYRWARASRSPRRCPSRRGVALGFGRRRAGLRRQRDLATSSSTCFAPNPQGCQ